MASEPPKVFISYNRADRDWAEWMAGVIKGAGYEPILDVWHFRSGQNFILRMQEATSQANLTIAVLSEAYLQASYTQPEWAAAFALDPTGKDRQLIPVRVGKCVLTGMLRSIIYILDQSARRGGGTSSAQRAKVLRRAIAASPVPRESG
jgi:TIR domain